MRILRCIELQPLDAAEKCGEYRSVDCSHKIMELADRASLLLKLMLSRG
jgi:hypothetical protein